MSGYLSCVLITLPMASLPFLGGGIADAKALGVSTSAPLSIMAKMAFSGLGRIEPAVDEADRELDLRVGLLWHQP